MGAQLLQFIASHGVWLVALLIALESIGLPLPGEASLMAAAVFAAHSHELDLHWLIVAGITAAILGNAAGFWLGRAFGHRLLTRYGYRVGLTENRIRIGQWLFLRYGILFVFTARFLPVLRNLAALLAGANCMSPLRFYLASTAAAVVWVVGYALAAHRLGEAFTETAGPVATALGLVAIAVVIGLPALLARYEKPLLARAEQDLSGRQPTPGG